MTIMTTNTRRVIFQASDCVGQVTLRSSPTVSRQKRWILWVMDIFFFFAATSISLPWSKTPPFIDGAENFLAGQVGIEPTTPAFGERCSAKLSYWPVYAVSYQFIFDNLNSFTLPHDASYVLCIVDSTFSTPSVPGHFDGFSQLYSSVHDTHCILM